METAPPFELKELRRDWIEGISGDAFVRRVTRRIETIRRRGIAAHTRGVMIAESDPVKFAAAFLAASHLRMPVILVNRRWGRIEWQEVGRQVNPAVIFGVTPLSEQKRRVPIPRVAPSTILIPTGGSSGGVRFARHRWDSLAAACEGLMGLIGPGPVHNVCVLPLFHVSGLMQLMRSLISGGRIAFPAFKDLQAGEFPMRDERMLCYSLVPTQLQRLIELRRARQRLLLARAIFVGGAPVPDSVLARARELKLPLFLSYGMTETAAMVAALPPDEFLAGQTNAGRPLNHVRLDVVDAKGSPRPLESPGRIRVRSRALFKGYHGGARFDPTKGYLTDDEGYFDQLGRLHILGRFDRLIISGGEKIDPLEVESAILETGAVEQVLVMGWPDAEWGQKLVAFYVSGGVESDQRHWEQELRAELAHYKLPKIMIEVKRLPLTAHGKVDRKLMTSLIQGALPGN